MMVARILDIAVNGHCAQLQVRTPSAATHCIVLLVFVSSTRSRGHEVRSNQLSTSGSRLDSIVEESLALHISSVEL